VIERWIRLTYYLDFVYRSIASLERQSFYGKIPDCPYLSALLCQGKQSSAVASKRLILLPMQAIKADLALFVSQEKFKVTEEGNHIDSVIAS
jgi:hypothetical protein